MARFPYLSVRSAAKIRLAVAAPPTRPMRHVRAGIFPEDWKSRLQASSERARNPPYAAAPWGSRPGPFDQQAPKDFLWQISHIK